MPRMKRKILEKAPEGGSIDAIKDAELQEGIFALSGETATWADVRPLIAASERRVRAWRRASNDETVKLRRSA